jgi:hypothetical protein
LVEQPSPRAEEGAALLVTHYLVQSWQYRRLLMRIPPEQRKHRDRLLDAMAWLLVDLHRNGVFWGDCSLANTLFKRDGQVLQAYLVDAETSELHPTLTDGQRDLDLEILVGNVAGGLVDLAARLEQPAEMTHEYILAAEGVRDRYSALWDVLHPRTTFGFAERFRVEAQIRALNDLGFAVDEVRLEPLPGGRDELRLEVRVAGQDFHAQQLQELTGLRVGEGQAQILLNDLRAYQSRLERLHPGSAPDSCVGDLWLGEVFRPGMRLASGAAGPTVDPVQAYCDVLEVRWLLSEEAGHDVGDERALMALASGVVPRESAASAVVAEAATGTMRALTPELLRALDAQAARTPSGPAASDLVNPDGLGADEEPDDSWH